MFSSKAAHDPAVAFARLAHGIVAAVEVLALLELVLDQVFAVRQLAVQAEDLLLVFGDEEEAFVTRRDGEAYGNVDFVVLVRIERHGRWVEEGCYCCCGGGRGGGGGGGRRGVVGLGAVGGGATIYRVVDREFEVVGRVMGDVAGETRG
nr:hypothetical protein CFP56_43773 [Quercus suber]